MDSKSAKLIVEHVIYEFFGKGNLARHEELVAKDIKCHCPSSWQEISIENLTGRTKVKKADQELANAFGFKKVEIEDLISFENKVLARWNGQGVHKGNFFQIAASQKRFDLTGQTLYQINKQGQIEEVWQSWDMLGLLGQIRTPFIGKDKFLEQVALLSKQEQLCIHYLLKGKTAKETVKEMKISFRTVEYYFENIKDKLGCFRKRDLFQYADFLYLIR